MSKLQPIKNKCNKNISFPDIKIAIAYLEVRNHMKNKNLSYKDDYALNANNTEFTSIVINSSEDEAPVTVSNLAQFELPSKCAPKLNNSSERVAQFDMETVPPITKDEVIDLNDEDIWGEDELISQNLDQLDQQMCVISEDDVLAQNVHQLDAVLSLSIEPNTTVATKTDKPLKNQYIAALDKFKYIDIKKSPSDSCLKNCDISDIKEQKQCSSNVTSNFTNGKHLSNKSEYAPDIESVKNFTSPRTKSIHDFTEAQKQAKPSNKRKLPDWMTTNAKSDCKTKSKIFKTSFFD